MISVFLQFDTLSGKGKFSTLALNNPGRQINLCKFLNDFWQLMRPEPAWRASQGTSADPYKSVCHGCGLPLVLYIHIHKINCIGLFRLIRLLQRVPHLLDDKMCGVFLDLASWFFN